MLSFLYHHKYKFNKIHHFSLAWNLAKGPEAEKIQGQKRKTVKSEYIHQMEIYGCSQCCQTIAAGFLKMKIYIYIYVR